MNRSLRLATLLTAATMSLGSVSWPGSVSASTEDGSRQAYYSAEPEVMQARSAANMRLFMSRNNAGYELQSYVAFGAVTDENGHLSTMALMLQRLDTTIDHFWPMSMLEGGVLFNRQSHPDYLVGGVEGTPDVTLPATITQLPWSIRAQSMPLAQRPQFADARVVKGQVGRPGAVYEFTSEVHAAPNPDDSTVPLVTYVRAKDVLGIGQWGFGPSGYFPQWIYPSQRQVIDERYDGSVARYLKRTGNPMTGQGSYYYSSPLLKVQKFEVRKAGRLISRGSQGWLWLDFVTQSYNARAQEVVKSIQWTEFSVQLPDLGQALKIGLTEYGDRQNMPYAMVIGEQGPLAQNGNRSPIEQWPLNGIRIRPDKHSSWTSTRTGVRYWTRYHVVLDNPATGQHAHLVMQAAFPNQEVVMTGRHVYEGTFTVSGSMNGRPVRGEAWGEIQPAGGGN